MLHLHQTFHVKTLAGIAEVLGLRITAIQSVVRLDDVLRKGKERVFVKLSGLLEPLLQTCFVGEHRLLEGLGDIVGEVAGVLTADAQDLAGHELGGDVVVE